MHGSRPRLGTVDAERAGMANLIPIVRGVGPFVKNFIPAIAESIRGWSRDRVPMDRPGKIEDRYATSGEERAGG
jgi:hypothetical protein